MEPDAVEVEGDAAKDPMAHSGPNAVTVIRAGCTAGPTRSESSEQVVNR